MNHYNVAYHSSIRSTRSVEPFISHSLHAPFPNQTIRHTLYPYPLPMPLGKLGETTVQMMGDRSQLMTYSGSCVLTNVDLLPSGGQIKEAPISQDQMAIHLFGDMGMNNCRQRAIVDTIAETIADNKQDNLYPLVVGLGDWIYPHGPENDSNTERQRIDEAVLVPLLPLSKSTSVFGVLGNHEYGDFSGPSDPGLFMHLANKKGINFPGRYYQLTFKGPSWDVDIIFGDSSTWPVDNKQADWICQQLQKSAHLETESGRTRWRLFVSHHPIVSYGEHEGDTRYLSQLLGKYKSLIDLSICGHEHDNEIINATAYSPRTIVTGTGCDARPVKSGPGTLYCSNAAAFASLHINKDALSMTLNEIPGV